MITDAQYCKRCDAWAIKDSGDDVVNWLKSHDIIDEDFKARGHDINCPCCGLLLNNP